MGVLVQRTRERPQFIAGDFFEASSFFQCNNPAADFREPLKRGFGSPSVHALAIPTEDSLVGLKERPLRGYQNPPDIVEHTLFRRYFIQQRDELHRSVGVRFQVTHLRIRADPNSVRGVHRQRPNYAGWQWDDSPAHAIVLADRIRGAEEEDSEMILSDGPDLVDAVGFLGRVVADYGGSDLRNGENRKRKSKKKR